MIDQLLKLADVWAVANDRSMATLATQVAKDGDTFNRLKRGGRLTTELFERFLSFFRDGGNWKDGLIPDAAADLLDNFENIATDAAASSGKADDLTDAVERAA